MVTGGKPNPIWALAIAGRFHQSPVTNHQSQFLVLRLARGKQADERQGRCAGEVVADLL
jgi:hypothetical protein